MSFINIIKTCINSDKYAFIIVAQSFAIAVFCLLFFIKYERNKKEISISKFFLYAVITSILIVFFQFIVGKAFYIYKDIGTDTFFQYYPYYVNIAEKIKHGTFSVWNWNYGIGKSIVNNVSWTFDPFALIVVLPGVLLSTKLIMYMLVWMQIVKILVIYFVSVKLFDLYTDNKVAVCLGAYLNAFNGYVMLWGQHYFLGTACVYTVLILYFIERVIQNRGKNNGLFLSLVITLSLFYGYYTTYMTLLVAAVYYFVRYIEFNYTEKIKLKKVLKDFIYMIFFVLRGVLGACVVLLPAAYYVTHVSGRLNGASQSIIAKMVESYKISFSKSDFGTKMSRLLSNNMLLINDPSRAVFGNYYETPQLFITIFIFFFIGQWIAYNMIKKKKFKEWIMFIVKCFLLYILVMNGVSALVFNAFAYRAYRYTFLAVFFLAVVVVKSWEFISEKGFSIVGMAIGGFLSFYAWKYSYKNMVSEVRLYVKIVLALLLLGMILQLLSRINIIKKYAMALFVILVIATTCFDDCITTNYRDVVDDIWLYNEQKNNLIDNSSVAIDWIKDQDDSFYRIEKNYKDWSVLSDSFIEEYSALTWYDTTANTNVLDFYDNIYTNALTGMYVVKYFTLSNELDVKAMNLTTTKYLLSMSELDNESFGLVNIINGIYIYKNLQIDSSAKWFTKTISKDDFKNLSEEEKVSILDDTLITDDVVAYYNDANYKLGDFKLKKQTVLEGTVECDGPGFVMLSVPDEEGWTAYCDGKKVKYLNADYGFIAVEVGVGNHNIKLKYSLPYFKMGLLLSILGLVCYLTEIMMVIILKKRKEEKTDKVLADEQ